MIQKNRAMRQGKTMAGNITVEAAFVMPIVLLTIFALIYLAFYLHDTCRIRGIMDLTLHQAGMNIKHEGNVVNGEISYENISGRGVFYQIFGSTQNEENQIKNVLDQELSEGLFLTKVKSIQVEVDKFKIKIIINSHSMITLPGISYLFKTLSNVQIAGEYPVHNPAETIRRTDVILDTASGIKGVDELNEKLEKIIGVK